MNEESLFAAALEKATAAERQAFLDEACGGDDALRQRVEKLLAADEHARGILERGPEAAVMRTAQLEPPLAPDRLFAGRFKLRQKLGEGGMGEVWVADQIEPVQRRVALKVVRPGFDSARTLARFDQERQALALMDHPNIAKVLDAGVDSGIASQESGVTGPESAAPSLTPDPGLLPPGPGRPYFVMELIKGVPITKYCDEARLSPRERLELFMPVCHAVQHAHQKGIIHRDLKPSNILVALYDGKPVPKVIDFGVAKATGPRLTEQSVYTEVGSLIGTLEYMSPEQAELNNLDIDTRSDIYALGAVLYELLTGSVPFSRQQLQAAAFTEMLRMIKEMEPPKPSTKLSGSGTLASVAAVRHTEPKKLIALVRGELDWIVVKCLEKDRARRYQTANGLALDLQRYLANEPVIAGPPSAGYRLRKFVRRNKGPVLAASVIFLLLVGGILGTTIGLIRAENQRNRALSAAEAERLAKIDAEQSADAERLAKESAQKRLAQVEKGHEILGSIFTDVDPRNEKKEGKSLRELLGERLQEAANQLDEEAIGDPLAVARLQRLLGRALHGLGHPAKAIPLLDKSRATFAAHLSPDHTETLQSMTHLGLAYSAAGQNDLALPLHQEALRLAKERYGPDSQATANAMHSLASSYWTARKLDLAIPLLEKTLKLRKATLGVKDPHTLETMNGLGLVYAEARKLDLAIPMLEETVELRREVLGPKHTDFLASLNNLAIAYQAAGKLDLALPRLEEVLQLIEAKVGPNHPNTLTTKNNLAFAYRTAGKLDLALPLAQQAVIGAEKAKFEHEMAWMFIRTLVDIHEQLKQFDQAEAWRRKWVAAVKEKEGKESVAYAAALGNLATAYWKARQFDKSIPLFEELLPLHRKTLGETDPMTLTAMANLGVNYRDAGRLAEAIALLEQAHGNGRKYESLRWVGGELLLAYVRAGKSAAASALAQDNVAAARKALPPDSPQLGDALSANGLGLLEVKAWAKAEPILRDCLAIRAKKAPDDWRTFNAKSMLGDALLGQQKYGDAEPLLRNGYEGMKQREAAIPANAKFRLPQALERLVQLYDALGKPDEAAKWRKELEARKEAEKKPIKP